MKETKVVMVGGSNGLGRAIAEKLLGRGVSIVPIVTVAKTRDIPDVTPSFQGLQMIAPRQHDKKCWKDAKRYGKKIL